MKVERLLIVLSLTITHFQLSSQDIIAVQALTWDSTTRSMMVPFPDIPTDQIEKIEMVYNMRCHDAAVGSGNVGCREWDYSCNTFITDSSRVDSFISYHPDYYIPNYSEENIRVFQ